MFHSHMANAQGSDRFLYQRVTVRSGDSTSSCVSSASNSPWGIPSIGVIFFYSDECKLLEYFLVKVLLGTPLTSSAQDSFSRISLSCLLPLPKDIITLLYHYILNFYWCFHFMITSVLWSTLPIPVYCFPHDVSRWILQSVKLILFLGTYCALDFQKCMFANYLRQIYKDSLIPVWKKSLLVSRFVFIPLHFRQHFIKH